MKKKMKRFLSLLLVFCVIFSLIPTLALSESSECPVADNVIDITDKEIYKYSSYNANAINIKISGADVVRAFEDGTTVDIILSGETLSDSAITVEFGIGGKTSLFTVSGQKSTASLENGELTHTMTIEAKITSSKKGTVTYTLNFSLDAPLTTPPECIKASDSISTYSGVSVELNLKKYFKNATTYYLVDGEEKITLDSYMYVFKGYEACTSDFVFTASNANGECADVVRITIEVTEIKSGAYLGITTSNGSINYVLFTDADGAEIDGLTAYLDGTTIKVSVPRTYAVNGKITAKFDLNQNDSGFPFITTSNQSAGTNTATGNKFTSKTTTLVGDLAVFTFYLYNSKPSAVNNSYTTYKIEYAIANELPVLSEETAPSDSFDMTADKAYTIDLDGIFVDPDEDDFITGWKVSIDGKEPVDAVVNEENVYNYQTNDAGVHTLSFYAKDNFNAISTDKYTVTLNVTNSAVTYDVTATLFGTDVVPVFYYTSDAKKGTELPLTVQGSVCTIKVPSNISMISWRADGVGMSAAVSSDNNNIILIKPVFIVMADEGIDENALVSVTHSKYTIFGSDNNYLLLGGEKYNFTAAPGELYIEKWNEGKLEGYTLSSNLVEINLKSKGTLFTFPYFAELTVSEASTVQGIAPKTVSPVKTTTSDYATGTKTATYELKDGTVYEYRVSVPKDNVNSDQFVTYAATFIKSGSDGIVITKDQIEAGDKGRLTIDRDVSNNRGRNVADLYTNVNAKGYKTLNIGESFKLIATRNYRGVNADWLMNGTYYYVEPEFHYTVINENGQEDNSVLTVDETGNIKAIGEGSAIVLITYDAMTLNHDSKLSEGALGDYPSTPNDFYGATWPENTGVFVVSAGSTDSGITTGMTINEDKSTGQKASGKSIDAELDVIYFIGEKGEYTFTPGTEGVSVFVANPIVSDKLSFTGFEAVNPNSDGSVTIPLTTGRNIVKLVKDDKAEYQVICAKGTNVFVNGEPLETAVVAPGQKVKIEFDNLFPPVNRMAIYNTSVAVVYSEISGCEGKYAGNIRSSMGEYTFASYGAKRTVENFISLNADGSGYSNSQVTTAGDLIVPEDFSDNTFTLKKGAFNIGGFMPYLLGSHYEKLGVIPPSNVTSENINCFLGLMPDISIPVGEVTGISATAPTKTIYNIGDVFDPSGMVVTVNFKMADGTDSAKAITAYTYDSTPFNEAGEKEVTISYGGMSASVTVTVTDVTLEALELTANPAKTLYYIGDVFDPSGMVITALYSDGSKREVTNYTYSPDAVSKDTEFITVFYGEKSVMVPVSVSLVNKLEVIKQPAKTSYMVGEIFDSSGMEVVAHYTDGSTALTDDFIWSPAGILTIDDTKITISYSGNEGISNPEDDEVTITVEDDEISGGDIIGGGSTDEQESINAYITFVDHGKIIVQDKKVKVYDDNSDGSYSIGEAFRALHRENYSGGESGYKEVSGNGVEGWVSKFWGESDSTFAYALNYGWAKSTNDTIRNGDKIAAVNGEDDIFYSDLYTWFEKSDYSSRIGADVTFKVNGLNLMASNATYNALHAPNGATVTVFDLSGNELTEKSTTVSKDGTFTVVFDKADTYTVKVSGKASWGSYSDAPVAPSTCNVTVSSGAISGGGAGGMGDSGAEGEEKNEEITTTLTPSVNVNSSGEAKLELNYNDIKIALEQIKKDNSKVLEIEPKIKGNVNAVKIKMASDSLTEISNNSLGINIKTSIANICLSEKTVKELYDKKGELSISVSKAEDKMIIDISDITELSGSVKVSIPCENKNKVMATLNKDGSIKIITKQALMNGEYQAILNGSSEIVFIDNQKAFNDISSHWAKESISFVTERELYQGTGEKIFNPDSNMTRAMLVTVLYRLEGALSSENESRFIDIKKDKWYFDAVSWANANNIVNGVDENSFAPDLNITREQVVTFLYRYAKYLGMSTENNGNLNNFKDCNEISSWSKDAWKWAVGEGLINGKPGNIIDSKDNATRAEVAAVMERFVKLVIK